MVHLATELMSSARASRHEAERAVRAGGVPAMFLGAP